MTNSESVLELSKYEEFSYSHPPCTVYTLHLSFYLIDICGLEKSVRFYQASTSELYGKVQEVPQTEKTPFYPRFVIIPGMNRLFPETRN